MQQPFPYSGKRLFTMRYVNEIVLKNDNAFLKMLAYAGNRLEGKLNVKEERIWDWEHGF